MTKTKINSPGLERVRERNPKLAEAIVKAAGDEMVMETEELKALLKKYPKRKSRGLGDSIAKATKAIGIKPCGGCKKRRDKLNELFPYKSS